MTISKPSGKQLASLRVMAAWLALDDLTDAATLARMIDAAFAGRRRRREAGEGVGYPSVTQRVRIIERDNSTCYMCHRKLTAEEITIEHVIPRSRGGDDEDSNLKVACEPCNQRKGNRLVSECPWLVSKKR